MLSEFETEWKVCVLPSGCGCDLNPNSREKSGPSQSLWQARGKTGSSSTRRDSKYARMVSSATLDSLREREMGTKKHNECLCEQKFMRIHECRLRTECRKLISNVKCTFCFMVITCNIVLTIPLVLRFRFFSTCHTTASIISVN